MWTKAHGSGTDPLCFPLHVRSVEIIRAWVLEDVQGLAWCCTFWPLETAPILAPRATVAEVNGQSTEDSGGCGHGELSGGPLPVLRHLLDPEKDTVPTLWSRTKWGPTAGSGQEKQNGLERKDITSHINAPVGDVGLNLDKLLKTQRGKGNT